jgi:uncharacterized protein (UPF0548 family)
MKLDLHRPTDPELARLHARHTGDNPTFEAAGGQPAGFRRTLLSVDLTGQCAFELGRSALQSWAVHHGAGIETWPYLQPIQVGATVALATRQVGVWLSFCCRVTAVTDEHGASGFTYATLPGHPERGEETFTVTRAPGGTVRFEIDATWRTNSRLARLVGPLTPILQRRASQRYLASMRRLTAGPPPMGTR